MIITLPNPVVDPGAGSSAPVESQPSFGVTLTGTDGRVWDLGSGPVRLAPGTAGISAPDVEHRWRTSPVIDGARWQSMRTPEADVVLPIMVSTEYDWRAWIEADQAIHRSLHPAGEATLTMTTPDGVSRSRGIRFVSESGTERNPLEDCYQLYVMEFTAGNPFWVGAPVSQRFSTAPPLPLFPGPPFNINPRGASSSSLVTNPGDEPAWPRYTITGPMTSFTVGIGDAVVSSATALTAGQSVEIDMDPVKRSITSVSGSTRTRVWEDMTALSFAAVPAGGDVPLNISVLGTTVDSSVLVEFTPLYRRPW